MSEEGFRKLEVQRMRDLEVMRDMGLAVAEQLHRELAEAKQRIAQLEGALRELIEAFGLPPTLKVLPDGTLKALSMTRFADACDAARAALGEGENTDAGT